jgi:hypothetical protein
MNNNIRLILTVNNKNNIETILKDYSKYIKDIVIYFFGSNKNIINFCISLLDAYNINYCYKFLNNVNINSMQYIIDSNIRDCSIIDKNIDFLLLLDSNDQIINLNNCLKQISSNSSYYECIIYYENEKYMLKNKFIISTKHNWKTYNSNHLIVNKSNDSNIKGEYIDNVWIKRHYNYSFINYNKIKDKIINPIYDNELLFALGKYYYSKKNRKTSFILIMFINSMNNVGDKKNVYDKELIYYAYLLLTKYYIYCVENNNLIINTIKKAIEIFPNRAEAYSTIGNYFYKIGNYELCYYNLEKALMSTNVENCFMCYQNDYTIENNYNIIIASIILDKSDTAIQYLKDLKEKNVKIYKYFIYLIKNNNLLVENNGRIVDDVSGENAN